MREVAVAAIAFVAEPFALGTPEDVGFGLPDVGAAAAEAGRLEAHRLQRAIARQDQQVGPGKAATIFLLDRPEQEPRLVEIGVVRPAVEWGEALGAGACATAAVTDAIGAGAVPGHPD